VALTLVKRLRLMKTAKTRARDIGIPFEGTPGPLNALTDVDGVEVGHSTVMTGKGRLEVGTGPVRTGVTAILPRGKQSDDATFAGWFSMNGKGEMTGTTWIEESGLLEGPIMITNTLSVGLVRDAVVAWRREREPNKQPWTKPVVAETWDGYLNDIFGFHVKKEHVYEALDSAGPGPVMEGNIGGGTGMICYEFKGGVGSSSRKLKEKHGGYVVGVLVQANHGRRDQLRIAGVPVGLEMTENSVFEKDAGSIIIVIGTDAPLLPHQLKRLARRAALGIARTGSISENGSGDIFIAFSTANSAAGRSTQKVHLLMVPNILMDPLFEATVQATEEAVVNALIAAQTMTGVDDRTVVAISQEELQQTLRKYNRLATISNR
jgi:L-aminopeptidase/D-esterase-like protein